MARHILGSRSASDGPEHGPEIRGVAERTPGGARATQEGDQRERRSDRNGDHQGSRTPGPSALVPLALVFPLETRAMAIAFFYAIGTAAGGVTGPLLFSHLVSTGKVPDTVLAFSIGASLMIIAGITEIFLGVNAERRGLADIAQPLTAADARAPQPRQARATT